MGLKTVKLSFLFNFFGNDYFSLVAFLQACLLYLFYRWCYAIYLGHMSQQKLNLDKTDEFGEDFEITATDSTTFPPTYLVIRVHPASKEEAVKWLVGKIRGKKLLGGAELVVLRKPYDEDGLEFHVSASPIKFLEIAEEMELVKRDKHGQMREFTVNDLENFLVDGMNVDDFLTSAERQAIIRHELENIRALPTDIHVPGYPFYSMCEGQSVLHKCIQCGIISSIYALHDQEHLKKLGRSWYRSVFQKQPLDEIKIYFGESIALYFTFLGFYTTALLFPTFLGFVQLLVSIETLPVFCIFNVIWVTVFLEMWRRKSNELAYKWGTIGMTSLGEPRANFRGQMGKDPITGKLCPQYPRYKTYLKMYCVSFPIVIACLVGAYIIMLISFWMEDQIKYNPETWSQDLLLLPSVLYTALVYVMNCYYRKLATFLTEWENHRTQSQFDRHRVTKLILFEFVNNFMSLFYIAFIIQDMEMLRSQVATMLIILQAINHMQEAVLPLLINVGFAKISQWKNGWKNTRQTKSKQKAFEDSRYSREFLETIPAIDPSDSRLNQAEQEGQLEIYEETYDDYLEMFIQFGYVVLFSSVYPAAALWAVINNVLEIRADAFRLCLVHQRPISRKVKDIGAWQRAFEVIGGLSIMTNCGLLCLSPHIRSRMAHKTDLEYILTFIFLEHILLGIRYLLHIAIPDKPEWVRVELAKKSYESRQALKHEKALKSKRYLTRRFNTVHSKHPISGPALGNK
ncbi:anoctamin-10 isoform X2 [Agrilus planipennis]|uniref:Anoctamin n=1 Tax=Agrilus planipennis TaxID=224129 RepID=A0A1W4WPM4_AGRPL|nr:anoctamin-10 isoform X2 [Agrilus planipennis]